MKKTEKASSIYEILQKTYPHAHCELNYKNPFELLIATILSAQCTDIMVNKATPKLFQKYHSPLLLAQASVNEVEECIRSIGLFKSKAKNIINCSKKIVDFFNGNVPQSLEELITLDGVGRKTANVVLGNAFDINSGVVVDTHVKRLSMLIGLSKESDPEKVEQDLMKIYPQKNWTMLSHLLIFHGRRTCKARNPDCASCPISHLCSFFKKSNKSLGGKQKAQ